jgi:hypothetical protein
MEDIERLIEEVDLLLDPIHDFDMDMEIIGQRPRMHESIAVPEAQHSFIEFPCTGSHVAHRTIEGIEQLALAEDHLGHSL